MFLTIFTASYNRAHTLKRLYESLTKQTNDKFEWLVVDDGSTDGSYEFLLDLQKGGGPFVMHVYQQENSGKHVAVNRGLDVARGDLFFIVDSDDYLPENSVDIIYRTFEEMPDSEDLIGISGVKAYSRDRIVGTSFSGDRYLDMTNLDRMRYGVSGDRAEIYYTSVLKRNKFPVFECEKFMSEAVIWDKLAFEGGKLRFLNDILYYCEYQDTGLSGNIREVFLNNWEGYSYYVNMEIKYRKYFMKKLSILYAYIVLAIDDKDMDVSAIEQKLSNAPRSLIRLAYITLPLYKKCLLQKQNRGSRFAA